MIRARAGLAIAVSAFGWVSGASAQTGFPFQNESLHYTVNWPSGQGLGDATLTARQSGPGWNFGITIQAGIPGYAVADEYRSITNASGCSIEFQRTISHGARKSQDQTVFDYQLDVAQRRTLNGGRSEIPLPSCAHDALAFVYYARRELGQGRVPPPEQLFYGPAHSAQIQYTGAQTIDVGEQPVIADRVLVYIQGPASDTQLEIFFARDPARTPLLVRVPFSVGTLSLELVR